MSVEYSVNYNVPPLLSIHSGAENFPLLFDDIAITMHHSILSSTFGRDRGDLARSILDRILPRLFFSFSRVVRCVGNFAPQCIVATEKSNRGSLLYSGFSERKASYWIDHFAGHEADRRVLGHRWCGDVCRFCRRAGESPDLAVFEESIFSDFYVGRAAAFRIPEWVDMVTDLTRGPDRIKKFGPGMRRAYDNGMHLSAGRGAAMLDAFYERMYVPYTKARHSDRAFLFSRASFEKDLATSEIYLLDSPEGPVAGFFIVYESGRRAYLRAIGMCDRSGDGLQWGLSDALYALTFAELHRRGFSEVSMGGARPFLNDGLTRYKMEWGAVPSPVVHHATDYFRLVPCRSSPAALRYLSAAPFWHIDCKGRLKLASVNGPGTIEDGLRQRFRRKGIDAAIAYRMENCVCRKPCGISKTGSSGDHSFPETR